MAIAPLRQNLLDWITQQWVILFGQKINSNKNKWLLGPFGNTKGIGLKFIDQLAKEEHLEIDSRSMDRGLLRSINQLNLSKIKRDGLSKSVIDFYENTSKYELALKVQWNPFFMVFGYALKKLFSRRIEQLHLPMKNTQDSDVLESEIIHLVDKATKTIKRTIWLRTLKNSQRVLYTGIYETCTMPNGDTCVKAIFPLPNGNATVILKPSVGKHGELILESSGKKFGDSGFYFLLNDAKGHLRSKYIKSFKDTLIVSSNNGKMSAHQTLTLWNLRVLTFVYNIKKPKNPKA